MLSGDASCSKRRAVDGLEVLGGLAKNVIGVPAHESVNEKGRITRIAVKDGFPCPFSDLADLFGVAREGSNGFMAVAFYVSPQCGDRP